MGRSCEGLSIEQEIRTGVDSGTGYGSAYSYMKALCSVKDKAHFGFDITTQVA